MRLATATTRGRRTSAPVRTAVAAAVVEVLEERRLLATASGTIYWDADGDGKGAGMEAAIGGHTVYVDRNNNGALDAGEPNTGVLSSGSYYFEFPDTPGTVTLRRVTPAGWAPTGLQSRPISGTGSNPYNFFGSHRLNATGSVSAQVFDDANGNGARDAGEVLLGDVNTYLDLNDNRHRDPNEPGDHTIGAGGAPSTILNLPAGQYTLRVLPRTDQTVVQTAPVYDTGIPVTVGGGDTNVGVAFGIAPRALFGRVAGFVYHDKNANGAADAGDDPLLSNRTVYADLNENGSLDGDEPRFTTQVDGYWLYLRPGTYTLRQVLNPGWRQTIPGDPAAGVSVTVAAASTYRANFATATDNKPTAISGGPYVENEGTPLNLDGSATSLNGGPFTYQWDYNYDGQTFEPSESGPNPAFPSDIISGPNVRPIALRVRDSAGIYSDVVATTVTTRNVAPTATFAATPSAVQAGQPSKLAFTNPKDPDPSDVAAGFRYSFDLNGDRVYDIVDTYNSVVTVPGENLRFTGPILLFGRITDKDGGSTEYVTSIQVAPAVDDTQSPYYGTALPLAATGTTTVQVENYDNGREGIAYHDTDSANLGGNAYRGATGVDLESITDGAPGVGVGFVKGGEWLEYGLVVMKRGAWNVGFRVASLKGGGSFHLEVDGVKVGNSITVPDTGGWTSWRTVTLNNVQLPEGTHTVRLAFDTNGGIGYVGNFNHMTFTPATVTPPPPPPPGYTGTPFKGTPAKVNATGASTIEAENFDEGGQGVAYHDTDTANLGKTTYRTTGVDVEAISDAGAAGFGVGFVKAGEWLKYTVDVAADGTYDLDVRLASLTGGGAFHVEVDGVRLTPNLTVPKTGAWSTYANVRQPAVSLKAGRHVVTLKFDANGSTGYVANFNWMRFTRR